MEGTKFHAESCRKHKEDPTACIEKKMQKWFQIVERTLTYHGRIMSQLFVAYVSRLHTR